MFFRAGMSVNVGQSNHGKPWLLTSTSQRHSVQNPGTRRYCFLLSVLPEKCGHFLWLLRAKLLDYAAHFLKKCDGICGIFMQFYAMKLRELGKTAVWWWVCNVLMMSRGIITSLHSIPMAIVKWSELYCQSDHSVTMMKWQNSVYPRSQCADINLTHDVQQ